MSKIQIVPNNNLKLRLQLADYDLEEDETEPIISGSVTVYMSLSGEAAAASPVDEALSVSATYVAGSQGIWTCVFPASVLTKERLDSHFANAVPWVIISRADAFVESIEAEYVQRKAARFKP